MQTSGGGISTKTEVKDKKKGSVLLALIQEVRISTFEAGTKRAHPHEFELVTSERTYRLVAESDADRRAWIGALQPLITPLIPLTEHLDMPPPSSSSGAAGDGATEVVPPPLEDSAIRGVSGRFLRVERDRFAALVAEGPTRSVWDVLGELGIQDILREQPRFTSEKEAAWRETAIKDMSFKELVPISKFAGGNAAAYGKGRLNGRPLAYCEVLDAEDVSRATGFYSHPWDMTAVEFFEVVVDGFTEDDFVSPRQLFFFTVILHVDDARFKLLPVFLRC